MGNNHFRARLFYKPPHFDFCYGSMMCDKFQREINNTLAGSAGTNSMLLHPFPLEMKGIKNFQTYAQYFFFGRSRAFLNEQNSIPFNLRYFVFFTNRFHDRIIKNINGMCTVAELSGCNELSKATDIR